MLKRLLSMIKYTKTYIRKSNMTSGNEYRITLVYKGERCGFNYHDNYLNDSELKDVLYCILLDSQAYDNSRDVYEFAREFGYDDMQQARKVYKACEKMSERVHRLFNEQELELLSEII